MATKKKTRKNTPTKRKSSKAKIDPNPKRGEKGDFVQVTVMLSPEIYELLHTEAFRRKVAKEPNPQISAILREAAVAYLGKG